ncbi:MAG: tetratricopeptide repeat protein [Chitinophagaceae bacterium]
MKYFYISITIVFIFFYLGADAQLTNPLQQGNIYYRQSQFDLAEKEYRIILKKDSLNTVAQHNLANSLYKQRRFDEAVAVLQKMRLPLKKGDVSGGAYYNEGVVYTKQQDLPKSIEAYKHALRNNPDDQEARENLQKALLQAKKEHRDKQSAQQEQRPSKMSNKESERQLEKLQKKEQEIQKRLQQKGQGSSMPKDW